MTMTATREGCIATGDGVREEDEGDWVGVDARVGVGVRRGVGVGVGVGVGLDPHAQHSAPTSATPTASTVR
jgi:hypothetical protein